MPNAEGVPIPTRNAMPASANATHASATQPRAMRKRDFLDALFSLSLIAYASFPAARTLMPRSVPPANVR